MSATRPVFGPIQTSPVDGFCFAVLRLHSPSLWCSRIIIFDWSGCLWNRLLIQTSLSMPASCLNQPSSPVISVQAWGTDALWYNGRIDIVCCPTPHGSTMTGGLWLCQGRNLHGRCPSRALSTTFLVYPYPLLPCAPRAHLIPLFSGYFNICLL